jgi:hypothetical protein
MTYADGHSKQPDSSFLPKNFPAPTHQNGIKHQPGTQQPFPTLCFEVAVTNEDRERLLVDAETKYFTGETSVCCWVGLKVVVQPVGGEVFWLGWGRRKTGSDGLRLMEQTENGNGEAGYLPVNLPAPLALTGSITIPLHLVFPVNRPNNLTDLVIAHEDVRQEIVAGLQVT